MEYHGEIFDSISENTFLTLNYKKKKMKQNPKKLHRPGIEPSSQEWEA